MHGPQGGRVGQRGVILHRAVVHGPQGGRVRCTVHMEGGWDGDVSSASAN